MNPNAARRFHPGLESADILRYMSVSYIQKYSRSIHIHTPQKISIEAMLASTTTMRQ